MSTDPASSYDEIPYSDHCFPYTHPDYLATLGTIHGLEPPPVDRCRVLELGCAGGGNLIPMALESPGATFVGIDLSPRQIAAARGLVDALGLENVELRAMSITDVDASLGLFDYIVCHGVYSWVPEFVRDKILGVCSERLTPAGIAYVSYNTYPGWHARGLVRDMLAFHVRGASAALDRVERARDFLEQITRALPDKTSAYARILSTEEQFLRRVGNSYVFHEHLEETNHPSYFQEFMALAHARGLRFLGEARTPGLIDSLPAESRSLLDGWADDEVAREQYLDFLCNRTFRRTLLCRAGQPRREEPSPEVLASMWISTHLTPVSDRPDVASAAAEEFRKPEGEAKLATNNPLVKAALVALHQVRPSAISLATLWERVRALLADVPAVANAGEAGPRELREAMLRCFRSNLVELSVKPSRFARTVAERPLASPLARLQARQGASVTNLRRRTVELGELDRLVLGNLDGDHDRPAIVAALLASIESDEFAIYEGEQAVTDLARIRTMIEAELDSCLVRMAGLALLMDEDEA